MLFSRRKKQEDLAKREAAGENLWTPEFDQSARVRLVHALKATAREEYPNEQGVRLRVAHQSVCQDLGLFWLHSEDVATRDKAADLLSSVLGGDADMVATVLEAVYGALSDRTLSSFPEREAQAFQGQVATILAEHRVAFDFVEGKMISFESREMHKAVVKPTLRLLAGRRGWDAVERAYTKALNEIADDPADAITDAGTALQEALTLLDCTGNALGPLAKSAVGNGLLSGHDVKLVDWVAADRSQTGDTHNATPATRDDAWFAVHIVGAILLRLSGSTLRT